MLENIRIVLVNTSHPGNIGAAARAMKNMGLSKLVLVDPVDHPTYEAYSRAAGADDVLGAAVVVKTLAEAVAGCSWVMGTSARERTVQWPMMQPRECAEETMKQAAQAEAAIVFGRERTGLTNEELEQCHALVNIPTNPDYSSLNVAAAVQVLSYELRLAALASLAIAEPVSGEVAAKHQDDLPATADQVDGMYQHLYQMLEDVKFFGTSNPEIVMRRLKGLFNRAQVTIREVSILRGIFSAAQGRKSARK
ncbi:MAG: tRNA (cytosine(32)/uridine(32)-2'-O)-methyltransferase TrmJ [Gammaproteobacteria bacterium]|nr:tRNA (cytosine(32)/uridine(32)-2'-O)-methyltransferase TrmJ [Gammaproteobacteria bacterium]MCW8923819.1 tRNA (cytosine(32)/uridine(32)-2'-O)-methyltransferase TrmJ [Gammaproteobacteria bacterium]